MINLLLVATSIYLLIGILIFLKDKRLPLLKRPMYISQYNLGKIGLFSMMTNILMLPIFRLVFSIRIRRIMTTRLQKSRKEDLKG